MYSLFRVCLMFLGTYGAAFCALATPASEFHTPVLDSKLISKATVTQLKGIRHGMSSIHFSPDGAWLVCRGSVTLASPKARFETFIFDTTSWDIVARLSAPSRDVFCVGFGSDSSTLGVIEYPSVSRGRYRLSILQRQHVSRVRRSRVARFQQQWIVTKQMEFTSSEIAPDYVRSALTTDHATRCDAVLWDVPAFYQECGWLVVPVTIRKLGSLNQRGTGGYLGDRQFVQVFSMNGTMSSEANAKWSAQSTFPHAGPAIASTFLPGGKTLVTSCSDQFLRFWKIPTGELAGKVDFVRAIPDWAAHADALAIHKELAGDDMMDLDCSPDGKLIALETDLFLALYDTDGKQCIAHRWWPRSGGGVRATKEVDFHPSGKYLATLSSSGDSNHRDVVRTVWSVPDLKPLFKINPDGAEHDAGSMAFSPSGEELVIGGTRSVVVSVSDLFRLADVPFQNETNETVTPSR